MWDSWEKTSEWSYGVLPEVGKTSGQWIRGNHAEIWAHPPTDYGCGVYVLKSQILLEYGKELLTFNLFDGISTSMLNSVSKCQFTLFVLVR